jgi:hypothetical protein
VRLESLGAMAALAAAVLTVEQRGAASTFGLVLSYALSITMLTSMTVRAVLCSPWAILPQPLFVLGGAWLVTWTASAAMCLPITGRCACTALTAVRLSYCDIAAAAH